uniref:Uncharacterized protein n=1 Tax=Rhizophora mucronata TaxID=61149 RepID=A0A2P2P1V6_RHIMU
MEFTLEISAG